MNYEKSSNLFLMLEQDRSVQNFIAQANSRYILFNVKEPEDNFPRYTEGLDDRLTSIAYTYLSVGCSLATHEDYLRSTLAFNKAASILEYIHVPEVNKTERSYYFQLTSALAYYAAFQYSKAFIVLRNSEYESLASSLISSFLKKDFKKLHEDINSVLLSDKYSDETIEKTNSDFSANYRVYTYFVAKSLALLLEYIYSGEKTLLQNCRTYLNDLLKLTAIDDEPAMWWITRLFIHIIDGFSTSSFWINLLGPLNDSSDNLLRRYIQCLAFGTPHITELFVTQREALSKVLSDQGAIISIPTSSGKTRIAEIAILQNLLENEDSVVLYLAPFRSLAYEIEGTLSKTFSPLGYSVSHLYGGAQFSTIDKKLIDDSRIIVATPEKAKALLRAEQDLATRIKLVVIDEGHLLGDTKRFITNEIFIEELRSHIQKNAGKIILLSAVLPNTDEISSWVTKSQDNTIKSKWRPATQRLGILEWTGSNVNISWKDASDRPPFNSNFITPFEKPNSSKKFPNSKREAIAASAVKFSESGTVLIFVGRKNMVRGQANDVLTVLKENKIEGWEWNNKEDWERFTLSCKEAYGNNSELFTYAAHGILCHSAGLPVDVRLSMERLMRGGSPRIIISTSTLAQGVNIGVSTVIISNVYISSTPIDSKDFWNIAGRAGRAFVDSEGKVLYTIDKTKSDWKIKNSKELSERYFNERELENVKSGILTAIYRLFELAEKCNIDHQTLLELVADNDYSQLIDSKEEDHSEYFESFFDWIDDSLLALNIAFSSHTLDDPSQWMDDYLRNSLSYIQAKSHEKYDGEDIISFFKARNKGVIKLAGDPSRWKSYVASGIPLRSSIIIESKIDTIIEVITNYKESDGNFKNLIDFIVGIESICHEFPSDHFQTEHTVEDLKNIRNLWIAGESIDKIMEISNNGLSICNEYFCFTLPWGVNAISRKLFDMEFEEEGELISELAMQIELGLPNFDACRIYLAGMKSRVAATEIASLLYIPTRASLSNIMRLIVANIDSISEKCSELTVRWLQTISKEETSKIYKNITLNNFTNEDAPIDKRIFIKEYQGNYYLVDKNWEYIDNVKIESEGLLGAANDMGVFFEFADGRWLMNVRNPYIDIN